MDVQTSLCFVFGFLMLFLSSTQGHKFHVGGKDGWVLNPSESYSNWASRNRFQVNDTLLFKFKKGEDSVLLVTRENYNECNINNPIMSLGEGESVYKFERSGPHYFISGNADHCNKGQKVIVVVMAVRPKKTAPPVPAPAPPTAAPAPLVSPPAATPTPFADSPTPSSEPSTSGLAPSPVATDKNVPSQSEQKTSSAVLGSSVPGVVLSVAIGVGVLFLVGGFNFS